MPKIIAQACGTVQAYKVLQLKDCLEIINTISDKQ
jgi:hypothetical protein